MLQEVPSTLKTILSTQAELFPECGERLASLRGGIDLHIKSLSADISQVEAVNKEYMMANDEPEIKRVARTNFMTEFIRFQNSLRWFINYLKTESANDDHERFQQPSEWFFSKVLSPQRFSPKAARTSRRLMAPVVNDSALELEDSVESLALAVRIVYLATKHLANRIWDEAFVKCRDSSAKIEEAS